MAPPPVINDDFQVIVAWIVAKFIYQNGNNCEVFLIYQTNIPYRARDA